MNGLRDFYSGGYLCSSKDDTKSPFQHAMSQRSKGTDSDETRSRGDLLGITWQGAHPSSAKSRMREKIIPPWAWDEGHVST